MTRRTGLVALAAAALVAGAVALVLAVTGRDDRPIAERAATLFPERTFAYVHASTDSGREAVDRALAIARRLEAFGRLQRFLVRRVGAAGAGELAAWVGDEAALGLIDVGTATAASLIAVEVDDEEAARRSLRGLGDPTGREEHRGVPISRYGPSAVAFAGAWLLAGPPVAVRAGIERQAGRGRSLADEPAFRRATGPLPDERAADAYATGDALRRVFALQGGLYAAAASLLDRPGLEALGMALLPGDERADVVVRSVLGRGAAAGGGFAPTLVRRAPANALAYLGVAGADRALRRALAVAGGPLAPLVRAVQGRLGAQGGRAGRELLEVLGGEVAVILTPGLPVPTLTLLARTADERRARGALDRVARPLARALGGGEPRREPVAGVRATTVPLGESLGLSYATFDGLVVLSTGLDGIRAIRTAPDRLPGADAFTRVLDDVPERVSSLVFLDLDQLLGLAELTGLSRSPTYQQVRSDLRRVRAIGASSTAGEGEATTRVRIFIP